MKIIFLSNSSSGLYLFRSDLIKELRKKHEVVVSVPFGKRIEDLEGLGCRLINTQIDCRGINLFADLKLLCRYCGILRKEKPDLVITYTIKPNVYGGFACRLHRVRYAANISGLGTTFQNDGMLKKLVTMMYKIGLKKAQTVFFENAENLDTVMEAGIVKQEKACLLNGAGVNLEHFQPSAYPEGDTVKFLFIGRVMKEKGIDELLSAMQMLRAEGANCTLDIVGCYEDDYHAVFQQKQGEGWLRFHGLQSDVRPFIAACHCLVLPSWHEGMANSNLEGAASARPVITSNIHGCLEAVEDGVSGFLCEKQDSENLYQTMKRFMKLSNAERKAMGLAGRKRMEEQFDKKLVVEQTITGLFSRDLKMVISKRGDRKCR